jgi:hypothetical protein
LEPLVAKYEARDRQRLMAIRALKDENDKLVAAQGRLAELCGQHLDDLIAEGKKSEHGISPGTVARLAILIKRLFDGEIPNPDPKTRALKAEIDALRAQLKAAQSDIIADGALDDFLEAGGDPAVLEVPASKARYARYCSMVAEMEARRRTERAAEALDEALDEQQSA